ncbi:MAG: hypothetical protein EBR82_32325 [Caulobacteraceae bacterium]|nr:hypothetical protein [Caulobacteraceae bacterium]
MFNRNLFIALGSALMLAAGSAAPALAQSSTTGPGTSTTGAEATVRGESVLPGRVGGGRDQQEQNNRRQQQRGRPAPAPTPEQVKAAAVALAAATNTGCNVAEAGLRGENAEKQPVYEVTCATGPGFILISSTPPSAVDCVILSGQADITRAKDPAADVGLQCEMPQNKNVLAVVSAYAAEAGVHCTIDQGSSVGKSAADNIIYEVGCAGADGYWLEKAPTGWVVTDCIKLVSRNAVCKYTTPAEQVATVTKWFEGSQAAACAPTEVRYIGSNANGGFYEAKCATGDGLIARFNETMAVQQVYPCAEAQRIGGGCKLTVVPAAPEAAPAPATQQ